MAISFVATFTDVLDTSTGLEPYTIEAPTGTQQDDLMVAFISEDRGLIPELATGWTSLAAIENDPGSPAAGLQSMRVMYRVFQSGDTSWSADFEGATSSSWAATVSSYRGVDASSPIIDAAGQEDATDGTDAVTATVNNTNSGAWRIVAFGAPDDGSWACSGNTERSELVLTAGSGDHAHATYDSNGTVATGNTSATGVFSSSETDDYLTFIGLIKPGDATPPAGTATPTTTANKPTPKVGVSAQVIG